MNVLLLNPSSQSDVVANREGTAGWGAMSDLGFAYPPHTLSVLAAACREVGINPTVLDAVGERLSQQDVIEQIERSEPERLVVFTSWGTLEDDCIALQALQAAFPDLPLIAVGTASRYNADELRGAGATHVLVGDPDLALAAFLTRPLPAPGLVHSRDLLPDQHNQAGLLRDPAQLPRPAWDVVPWQKYGFLTLFGARGCEDRCKFCAYITAQGRAYRPRPVQDVVDEMLWLQETFQPRRIMVRDPVFAFDRTRTMALARMLAAADFHTPWDCESRPEHFDRAMLRVLARAGCRVLKLGIESANPEQLTAMGRVGSHTEAATYLAYTGRVVADARRFGIATHAFVLVGLPGQTLADTTRTADYLRAIAPSFIHIRPYIAYPRVALGPAQHTEAVRELMVPLQAVTEERLAAARRPASLAGHLRNRIWRLQLWLRLRWDV
ncbi:MAG TPA: radical SAM protein [Caldilineae bacterium]|nr:radical SAM protein [Caldilineae bacterium]